MEGHFISLHADTGSFLNILFDVLECVFSLCVCAAVKILFHYFKCGASSFVTGKLNVTQTMGIWRFR